MPNYEAIKIHIHKCQIINSGLHIPMTENSNKKIFTYDTFSKHDSILPPTTFLSFHSYNDQNEAYNPLHIHNRYLPALPAPAPPLTREIYGGTAARRAGRPKIHSIHEPLERERERERVQ